MVTKYVLIAALSASNFPVMDWKLEVHKCIIFQQLWLELKKTILRLVAAWFRCGNSGWAGLGWAGLWLCGHSTVSQHVAFTINREALLWSLAGPHFELSIYREKKLRSTLIAGCLVWTALVKTNNTLDRYLDTVHGHQWSPNTLIDPRNMGSPSSWSWSCLAWSQLFMRGKAQLLSRMYYFALLFMVDWFTANCEYNERDQQCDSTLDSWHHF